MPTASSDVRAPSLALFLTEPARTALHLGTLPLSAPWLTRAPRPEQGHGVLVLPGLMTTDSSTALLRRFVHGLGHTAWGWRLGRNLGPTSAILDGMPRAAELLAERTGGPISIIGWSLGGVFGRELARRRPELVRQVITLGSPFALTDPAQSRAGFAFRRNERQHVAGTGPSPKTGRPIPVPSTAVYSKRDGVVHWRSCVEPASEVHANVEVRCAHLAFGADPGHLVGGGRPARAARSGCDPVRPAAGPAVALPVVRLSVRPARAIEVCGHAGAQALASDLPAHLD